MQGLSALTNIHELGKQANVGGSPFRPRDGVSFMLSTHTKARAAWTVAAEDRIGIHVHGRHLILCIYPSSRKVCDGPADQEQK